jgi:hypothetical protein
MSSAIDTDSAPNDKSEAGLAFTCPPPESSEWIEILHWCLMVLGTRHRDSAITASLLSYAHNRGGLTPKQAVIGERIADWLAAEYRSKSNV